MEPQQHLGLVELPDLSPQLMITLKPRRRLNLCSAQVEISSSHIPVILPGLGPVDGKQVPENHSRKQLEVFQGAFTLSCPLQTNSFILGLTKKSTSKKKWDFFENIQEVLLDVKKINSTLSKQFSRISCTGV